MPWLANDTLEGEEARRVRKHVAECERCRLELGETLFALKLYNRHLPADALIDYAYERVGTASAQSLIENHLRDCDECAEELRLVRESRALEEEPAQVIPISAQTGRPAFRWQYAAMAATLLAFILVGGWLRGRQQEKAFQDRLAAEQKTMSERLANQEAERLRLERENEQLRQIESELRRKQQESDSEIARLQKEAEDAASPHANILALDVYPSNATVRSSEQNLNELQIPSRITNVTLILNSQSGADFQRYDVEIANHQKRIIWQAKGLIRQSTNDYTISLPARFLSSGSYRIRIYEREKKGRKLSESYDIRVIKTAR